MRVRAKELNQARKRKEEKYKAAKKAEGQAKPGLAPAAPKKK